MKKIFLLATLLSAALYANELTVAMDALEKGDFKTAFRHFKIAAEQGDPIAQQNLAVMYNNGYGTKKNRELAAQWFEKADSGHAKVAIR